MKNSAHVISGLLKNRHPSTWAVAGCQVCCPGKVCRSLVLQKVAGGRVSVACKGVERIISGPEAPQLRGIWAGVLDPF